MAHPKCLAPIFVFGYIPNVAWDVEFTDEFESWWNSLEENEQDSVAQSVRLLEEYGPTLPYPYSSGIESSNYGHMRELRIQHHGRPYRVLYAFDPRSTAILLIGGEKTGRGRWYEQYVPIADRLYEAHLSEISNEEGECEHMGKKWRDLYDSMPPERRARIEAGVARQVADMPLAELRRARALTQQQIAQNLEVNQAWVSKVERQTDMYVSTLRSYIEAMGGDLDIIARFGDGVVRVRQFGELLSEEAGLSYSEPPLDVSTRQHAVPQVKVWSPQPSPSAITDAQPKARVWEGGESSTPGQKTPGRSITTKVA